MYNDLVFRAPESFMKTDLDCGADSLRVAMCRGPLMFIEKVNLFLLLSRSVRFKIIKFRCQKLVCFFQALDEHAYDWNLKDFTSSIPHILSLPPVTYDSTFGCDSPLTEIIVRKSDLEFYQKICLFKSMKTIADGLDCGEDSLQVVMCRGPFLLLEQVSF